MNHNFEVQFEKYVIQVIVTKVNNSTINFPEMFIWYIYGFCFNLLQK